MGRRPQVILLLSGPSPTHPPIPRALAPVPRQHQTTRRASKLPVHGGTDITARSRQRGLISRRVARSSRTNGRQLTLLMSPVRFSVYTILRQRAPVESGCIGRTGAMTLASRKHPSSVNSLRSSDCAFVCSVSARHPTSKGLIYPLRSDPSYGNSGVLAAIAGVTLANFHANPSLLLPWLASSTGRTSIWLFWGHSPQGERIVGRCR